MSSEPHKLPELRRIVTKHDTDGKAVVGIDGAIPSQVWVNFLGESQINLHCSVSTQI